MNTSVSDTSPYQAPQEELLTDTSEVGEIRFFSSDCRIGRLRYLAHGMLVMIAFYLVIGVVGGLSAVISSADTSGVFAGITGLVIVVGYIPVVWLSVVFMIQRLHDQDLSGWLCLLMFIPIANLVIAVMLMFIPGTQGANRFGPPPPPNKTWHWIAALALPAVFVLGILAAVAIPAYQDYVERAQSQTSIEIIEERVEARQLSV